MSGLLDEAPACGGLDAFAEQAGLAERARALFRNRLAVRAHPGYLVPHQLPLNVVHRDADAPSVTLDALALRIEDEIHVFLQFGEELVQRLVADGVEVLYLVPLAPSISSARDERAHLFKGRRMVDPHEVG